MAQVVRPSTVLRGQSAKIIFAASLTAMSMLRSAYGAGKGVQVDKVARGTAQFQFNGPQTTIRASNGAIINYKFFNIDQGQSVQFVQPSATSRVLNRISGAEPSKINGLLQANGIVYLVNPSGVIFGPHSVLDVGRIYAAGGNITDSDFLANINRFALSGPVLNQGAITGQQVHLLGTSVANEGSIKAEGGLVSMVAGDQVTLGTRDGHIVVKVGTADVPQQAAGGANLMGAGDMYSFAIKNSGTIKAGDVHLEAQGQGATNVSGKIDASNVATGGKGGNVVVTGHSVALNGATIDASGDAGGGKVLVGGDLHGQGETRNATLTSISSDSVIRADALSNGSGGMVIVWSDELTQFSGAISARGGALGGDGGFAEVSGKNLAYHGKVDLSAPKGKGGNLLIDPLNLDLVDDGTAGAADSSFGLEGDTVADGDTTTYGLGDNPGVDVKLQVSTVTDVLKGGETVTLAAEHNLTIDSVIDVSASAGASGAGLNLRAGNDITINKAISLNGGVIDLHSNDPTSGFNSGVGNVTINAPINTNGGSFHSAGVGFDNSNNGTLTVISASFDHTGNVLLVHNGDLHLRTSTIGGTLGILNSTDVTIDPGQTISTGGQVGITVQLAGALFTVGAGASLQTATGGVIVKADRINLAGTINAAGQQVTLMPVTGGTFIDLGSNVDSTLNTLELSSAELNNVICSSLQIGRNDAVASGDITASTNVGVGATWQTLSFQTGGAVGGAGTITAGALSIASTNGVGAPGTPLNLSVDMLAVQNSGPGTVDVSNDKALAIATVAGFNGISSSGNVNITADSLFISSAVATNGGKFVAAINHDVVGTPLGTINTSSAADGGSAGLVNITSSLGMVNLAGTVTTTGSDNPLGDGGNGASVNIIGTQVGVGAINTSGGNATGVGDNNGGAAGPIVLVGNSATPGIMLDGNLTAAGGSPSGAGVAGSAAEIDIETSAQVTSNITTNGSKTVFFSQLDGLAPGAQTLSITGDASFLGAVGSGTPLKSITVAGSTTVQGGSVTTIGDQTYQSGLTIAVQDLTLDTGGGNLLVGGALAGGANNLILAAGIGAGSSTFTGDLTNVGSGTGPAITIRNGVTGLVDFKGAVVANGGVVAEAGNSNVKFESGATLASGGMGTILPGNVTMLAGTFSGFGGLSFGHLMLSGGAVTLDSKGSNIQITSLDGGSQNLILASGIGSGTTTITGDATNLGSGTGAALTIQNGVIGLVRFGGSIAANSGLVAASSTSTVEFDNTVTLANGDTGTILPGAVALNGGSFSGFDTLSFGATTIGAPSVSVNSNATNLHFDSIAGGGNALTLDAGATGSITVTGPVTALSALTIANSSGADFLGDFNVSTPGTVTILDTKAAATIKFDGNASFNTLTATNSANAYSVAFNAGAGGQATTIGTATFNNTGTVSLGNDSADRISFSVSGLDTITAAQHPSSTVLAGDVETTAGGITVGPASLAADTMLNHSASNAQDISIGALDGAAHNLVLGNGIGTGKTTFTGAVTNLGTGTDQALLIEASDTGLVEFKAALTTNSGIAALSTSSNVKFDGDVTLNAGTVSTNLPGNVEFDGVTVTSFDVLRLGSVTLGGAGATTLNSKGKNIAISSLTGAQNLVLDKEIAAGLTSVTGNVTNLGSGTGAAITVQSGVTGTVEFLGTVTAKSGIQAPGADSVMKFDQNVTLANGDTGTNLAGSVTMSPITFSGFDGLTYGSLVLTGSGATTLNSNGGNISIATITGANNLILAAGIGAGQTTITGDITNLGTGTGAALNVQSGVTGKVEFKGTVAANSGLLASGVDSTVVFDHDVTLTGGDTGTILNGAVTMSPITFSGVNGMTFGTLTLPGAGITTITTSDANHTSQLITFVNGISGSGGKLVVDTSGNTIFGGGVNIASLTTDASGTTHINGGSVTTTAGQTYGDDVILGSDTVITQTLSGADVLFAGKVNDASTANLPKANLTLAVAGTTTFTGTVGDATTLGLGSGVGPAITINSSGPTTFNSTVHVGNGIFQNEAANTITFKANVTAEKGDTGSVFNSSVALLNGITFTSGGDLSFGSASSDLLTLGGTTITLAAGGANVAIKANVDSADSNSPTALVINNGTGASTVSGAIGASHPLASITTDAGGSASFASITTVGKQELDDDATTLNGTYVSSTDAFHVAGNVTLTGNTTVTVATGKNITFDKPINDTPLGNTLAGIDVLALTAKSGKIEVNSIGDVTPIGQLIVGGNTQSLFTPGPTLHVATNNGSLGDVITVGVPMVLSTSSTFKIDGAKAADMSFASTINAASNGAQGLVMQSNGGIVDLGGGIGLTAAVNNFVITDAKEIRLANDVKAIGGRIAFGGQLKILGDVLVSRDAVANDVNTGQYSGRAGIFFGNSIDSFMKTAEGAFVNHPFRLTVLNNKPASADISSTSFPLIVFSGPIGSSSPLSVLHLNTPVDSTEGFRTNTPQAATIVFGPTDINGDLLIPNSNTSFSKVIKVVDDFTVGRREKISVLGSLTIQTESGAEAHVIVGDVNALQDLTIIAPKVQFQRREGAPVKQLDGTVVSDSGVDIIAGHTLRISAATSTMLDLPGSNPTNDDSSTQVVFAAGAGAPSVPGNFKAITRTIVSKPSDMVLGGSTSPEVLDLQASGQIPPATDGSNAIAGAIQLSKSQTPSESATPLSASMTDLSALGIHTRNLTQEELMQGLDGHYFFMQPSSDKDLQVAIARLDQDAVFNLVRSYQSFFFATADGKVVAHNQKDQIRDALARALAAYHQQYPTARAVVPSEFRAFVAQSPEHRAAASYLANLRAVLDRLNYLNLTERELGAARTAILNDVKPAGISTGEFEAVVMTPSGLMAMK